VYALHDSTRRIFLSKNNLKIFSIFLKRIFFYQKYFSIKNIFSLKIFSSKKKEIFKRSLTPLLSSA
jgi:hypothetical protein